MLPNNIFHDIMLQVCTCIYIYLFQSPQTLIRVKSSHHSASLKFSFSSIGNQQQIWIGTKLQEVGSRCNSMKDGPSSIMPWLVPTCPTSGTCAPSCSGKIEEDELVPGQFDSPPTKKLHTEAGKGRRPRLARPLG